MKEFTFGTPEELVPSRFCDSFNDVERTYPILPPALLSKKSPLAACWNFPLRMTAISSALAFN